VKRGIGLVLIATACGAQLDLHLPARASYDFWLDSDMSTQTREAVAEAVAQWTTYTDVQIALHDGDRPCVEAGCFFVTENSLKLLSEATDTNWDGWTTWGIVFIKPGESYDETQHTVTHEFGHALGLVHHPLPYVSVMAPGYRDAADHVACDDVLQFYSVRGIDAVPASVTPCTDSPGALPWDGGSD